MFKYPSSTSCDWSDTPGVSPSANSYLATRYPVEFMHRRPRSFRRDDYATLYSNVTRANAPRPRPRSTEESNREWTHDSTREISIVGYIVGYNARWLVIPVRSRGGDLYYRLENGRIRYTSKPHSSRCSYRFGNELSTQRLISERNADTLMQDSTLLIV